MNQPDRILLVDDSAMNRVLIETILSEDYQLMSVNSGEEALAVAPDFRPDLILLDVMMPGIDGLETCRRLRNDEEMRHAKIILLSARAKTEDRLEGYRAGADDFIPKPFDPDELLAKVEIFLRMKFVEELDLLKMDIIYLLNHETRTPFTGIIGALQVLGMGGDLQEHQRQELIDIAMANCDRLEGLIQKSLLLCELQSGVRVLGSNVVVLGSLLNQILDKLADFATDREVTVKLLGAKDTYLVGDEEYLLFMLESLVHNGIRFSFPGNEVRVVIHEDASFVTLSVLNTGTGIKETYLPYVFQAFAPQDVAHHTKGHGLSLAVCREIIKSHGGHISVVSTPGGTTTVTVQLPLPLADPLQGSASESHEYTPSHDDADQDSEEKACQKVRT